MKAIDRFKELQEDERFRGWPVVGEPSVIGELPGGKIPFFGQVLHTQLRTPAKIEDYYNILRHFGWVVVFGVTADGLVPTLCQWKPGVNCASWELPPGGIGKTPVDISDADLLRETQSCYLKETGFGGGNWSYLGHAMVESGKFRGASANDHGLKAHMFLADGLEQVQGARRPAENEIMETIMVPLSEWPEVIESGLFKEVSALPCAMLALRKLGKLTWAD